MQKRMIGKVHVLVFFHFSEYAAASLLDKERESAFLLIAL